MKVLLVHGRYRSTAPSGENNVVDQEAAALAAAGHDVKLFERNSDDIAGWSLPRKAALPARTLWNEDARRDLRRSLDRIQPDVVHVHNTFPLITPSVLHAARDAGVPVVATVHNYKLLCASGDFFRKGVPCHDCAEGQVLPAVTHGCYRGSRVATLPVVAGTRAHRAAWRQLVSAYIFISAAQRELMRGLRLPPDRVFVKHNFVPAPDLDQREPEHVVMYLGRLDAAKGAPFLMRAWDAFLMRRPESTLRLVIAGGGPLAADVAGWAASRPSVQVAGLLPREEATALLGRAIAAVIPSQWEETFGLVAVEAMAAGVAPLVPGRGSFPELVEDGETGVIFPAEDPVALAAALEDVDRRPARYTEMGSRGRLEYERRFQSETNVEQLIRVYRFAVSNPANTMRAKASPSQ